jgi:hypothetical protein
MASINPVQLQKHLKGMDYPASKQDLIDHAKKNGADENALSVLEKIAEDQYETPTDVNKAVGKVD